MLKLQYAEAELAEHNHVFDACKVDFINAHNERLNKFPKSTRGKIDNFLVEKFQKRFYESFHQKTFYV